MGSIFQQATNVYPKKHPRATENHSLTVETLVKCPDWGIGIMLNTV
jgi:hypothetical protein